jgi:hypothetical protein
MHASMPWTRTRLSPVRLLCSSQSYYTTRPKSALTSARAVATAANDSLVLSDPNMVDTRNVSQNPLGPGHHELGFSNIV